MLVGRSECSKLGPEIEASVFMRATSVVVMDFPHSAFDAHYRCEMIQRGGLEERQRLVSVETIDAFVLHYVRVNAGGQILSNQLVRLSCVYFRNNCLAIRCNHFLLSQIS